MTAATRLVRKAKGALMIQKRTIASLTAHPIVPPLLSASVRPVSIPRRSIASMNKGDDPNQLQVIVQKKRALGSKISRALTDMDPIQRSQEEGHAQIRKKLYVPRVEDGNSNMRMLRISSFDDLSVNSMNILEPPPVDCDGNRREDVMQASEPVDLFILPGLAFDRSGRRLGRSGGFREKTHQVLRFVLKELQRAR